MKSKDGKIFLEALEQLEKEKGINKESLLEAVEQAMLAAYKKHYGEEENVEVEINRSTGEVKVFEIKTVVTAEDLYDAALEVSVEDAVEAGHKSLGEMQSKTVNKLLFKKLEKLKDKTFLINSKLKNMILSLVLSEESMKKEIFSLNLMDAKLF